MTFFQNDRPPSSKPGEEERVLPHSPRSAPLFKQEASPLGPLGGHPVSLGAYVAQHLNEQKQAPPAPVAPTPPRGSFVNAAKPRRQPSEHATTGQFLNSLDVDLPSGLEQYLPTPVFRLRVVKKRLDGEIAELQGLLFKYKRLDQPSPDLRERISAVQHRLRVLENHERRVSWQLAEAIPMGVLCYQLSQMMGGLQQQWSRSSSAFWQRLVRFFYGQSYWVISAASVELMALESIYRKRMGDSGTPSAELGQLVNRYERTLAMAEKKAKTLSANSFWRQLWQQARGLVE
ncbi:hypothetical protein [Vampirovibrio sp.]|uniref:hypothetical protein n=1 Tax=Vampirovibrio sp. TaxID=2717857 RepID=UPI00359337D3